MPIHSPAEQSNNHLSKVMPAGSSHMQGICMRQHGGYCVAWLCQATNEMQMGCGGYRHAPVTLIANLKVLAGVGPVEGGHVVVTHPHEALGAQHRLDGGVSHFRRSLPGLCILRHRHPAQHCVPQPAHRRVRSTHLQLPPCLAQSLSMKHAWNGLQSLRRGHSIWPPDIILLSHVLVEYHKDLLAVCLQIFTSVGGRAACVSTQSCGCHSAWQRWSPGGPMT